MSKLPNFSCACAAVPGFRGAMPGSGEGSGPVVCAMLTASSAGRELLGTRWNPMDFCSPKVPLKNVGEVGVVHSKKGLGLW